MVSLNPLASLFGRSPIKPIQEHMSLVIEAVNKLPAFFAAVLADDWGSAGAIHKEVSRFENEADAKKKDIRLHLPKSLFLPVPRSDLLELLAMQDSIANGAKDISGIILGRKMKIPVQIQNQIQSFLGSSIATSEQALKAINELDELLETGFSGGYELDLVERMITELDQLEHKADREEVEIRAALFSIEKELAPVDVIFLYGIIDGIGELANRAQKVGSRLQLLLAR